MVALTHLGITSKKCLRLSPDNSLSIQISSSRGHVMSSTYNNNVISKRTCTLWFKNTLHESTKYRAHDMLTLSSKFKNANLERNRPLQY